MNNTFILLKANLADSFSISKLTGKTGGRYGARTTVMGILIVAAVISIAAFAGSYYWLMADVLFEIGMESALIMMVAVLASVLSFFMALYKAPGYLYASKDFNMLAALPVKPGAIMASKLLSLYVTGFVPAFLLTLPGIAVFGIKSGAGALFYITGLLGTLLLPLVPLVIGAALAFPIMYAGTKFRYSNAVVLILYLILIVALIVGSYAIPLQTPEQMEAGAEMFSNITRYYPPVRFYSDALLNGGVTGWLLLALVSAALPAVLVVVFAKMFLRINAALSESRSRSNYKLRNVSVSSVFGALLGKEVKLFFSSTMYVMNTAIGMVMYTIFVAALAIMGFDTVAMFMGIPGGGDLMLSVSSLVAMFCVGMCMVTAPSISMEGSGLWIIKTLPLRFWDIAKAKIALNLLITVPLTIINTAVLTYIVGEGAAVFIGLSLALIGFCVFTAVSGLIVNLYFPKLDWKNPTQAVKQSASVIIAIALSFAVTALCGVGYYFLDIPFETYVYIAAVCLFAVSASLTAFLRVKGQRLFDNLLS
jgi:ABC-2 type transport system permease protein